VIVGVLAQAYGVGPSQGGVGKSRSLPPLSFGDEVEGAVFVGPFSQGPLPLSVHRATE
jgi:hypothetical protein